ncbi:DUF4442 domain-containing protein [Oligoflexus tunisiensis]|uniref:DUF4442 domain-containing protein n=1 Tax=Oligoflexus tunisiensis TaxID=708132 RepID=UPI000AA9E704|nr:DUF4442 domain-containing protein [Oligoflexus tunisiensis]
MALKLQGLMTRIRGWNDGSRNVAREGWDHLSRVPRGKQIFSYLIGRYAPYTGTIGAVVEELREGHSEVSLQDNPKIRNHLQSIHAVALANLAELTGNIALSYSMPPDARFIVSKMEIEYLKKARGKVTGICDCPIPTSNERKTWLVPVDIFNEAGEIVCTAVLHSLVGPKK